MKNKTLLARKRRITKIRSKIREAGKRGLVVHRTPNHIYAQVVSEDGSKVLAAASSVEKVIKSAGVYGGGIAGAQKVGALVAERALAAGVSEVAFDRSGFKYHGRVKALAEAARAAGMAF